LADGCKTNWGAIQYLRRIEFTVGYYDTLRGNQRRIQLFIPRPSLDLLGLPPQYLHTESNQRREVGTRLISILLW